MYKFLAFFIFVVGVISVVVFFNVLRRQNAVSQTPVLQIAVKKENFFGVNDILWTGFDKRKAQEIKNLGVGYVRIHFFPWRMIEKEKGRFIWADYIGQNLDDIVALLREENLAIEANVLTVPTWARKELLTQEEKNIVKRFTQELKSRGLDKKDLQNPQIQEKIKTLIEKQIPDKNKRDVLAQDIITFIRCQPLDEDKGEHVVPKDPGDYARFIAQAVRRYKPGGTLAKERGWGDNYGIRYWEVFNETDIEYFWCGGTDKEYVQQLQSAYQAIKKEDPGANVLMAGLSGAEWLTHRPISQTLDSYYQLGIKNYFDVMAFHFYSALQDYDHPQTGLRERIAMVKAIMEKYGDTNKPIWQNEGCNGQFKSERDQAEFMVRFFTIQLAKGINKVFWFQTQDIPDGESCGLVVKKRDAKRLGYYTYRVLAEKLSDFESVQAVMENNSNVYVYKFIKDRQPFYVVWWDYWREPNYQRGQTKQVKLNENSADFWVVSSLLPSAQTGAQVKKPADAFAKTIVSVENGVLSFSVGEDPVFVDNSYRR